MKWIGRISAVLILGGLLALMSAACGSRQEAPVVLTLWHVYGGQTDSPLNHLIEEFNATVGEEAGIYVQVTSVSNTNTIHQSVLASANADPGAGPLPDLFISYPKTVLALPDRDILVDYRDYFTPEELSAYIPDFLEEGTVDGKLLVFPVAKSTEVLFLNQTAFDRYAAETGARVEDLSTWEGLFRMAADYTAWSDRQTPQIPDDGRPFFVHDYHFNYFQVGAESLGEPFFAGDGLALGPAFDRAWEPYAEAALQGGVWLQEGYATEPLRTGDAVASVASSASVLYYSDQVTYPDNTSEQVTYTVLPCPVFAGGEKLVSQRGAGLCALRSTPRREQAAITFLKWLTAPEVNVEFVTSLGYMPVTEAAFTDYLPDAIEGLEDGKYQALYRAFLETQREYRFYTPPQMEHYLELETGFEYNTRLHLSTGRRTYLDLAPDQRAGALGRLVEETKEAFRATVPS